VAYQRVDIGLGGGDAICIVSLDEAVSQEVLDKVAALPQVVRANRLQF
jgi:hypothetical protein